MTGQGRVIVLHGACADRPDEADTLVQVEAVVDSLTRLGWRPEVKVLASDCRDLLAGLIPRPELVFNLVEAINGDGRLIHLVPRSLERLGVPYSGASARALFDTTWKPYAKARMRAAGLPTPDWLDDPEDELTLDQAALYVVKPAREDASLGIDAGSLVPARRVAEEIAARSARFGGDWFAEAYVEGREFNLSLLECDGRIDVLPVAEILFVDFPEGRPHIVDYEAKWDEKSFAYHHTPRHFDFGPEDAMLLEQLRRLAVEATRLFDLRGYARVDFRVDRQGKPWILEVNANPCLAPDAGFVAAARQAGLDFDRVVDWVVRSANSKRDSAASHVANS